MKLTKAFCFAVCAAGFIAATPAPASSAGSLYDMDRMLSAPHPLANQYGTRWRPAAVQTLPPTSAPAVSPRSGVAPVATPVVVPARQTRARPTRTAMAKKQGGYISEIKIGALVHDQGPFSSNKEDGVDTNVEIRFVSPDFLKAIWSPRPHIGFNANSSGNTSSVFIGLTYEWDIWKSMFAGFSLGGAIHNGETDQGTAELDEKELGCRVLFRESIEVGFRFGKNHSLSGFLDHISNAKLCDTNEGVENAGIRYGYRF